MVKRRQINATLEPETIKWLEEQVTTQRFRNMSHAIEYAVLHLKDTYEFSARNGFRAKEGKKGN